MFCKQAWFAYIFIYIVEYLGFTSKKKLDLLFSLLISTSMLRLYFLSLCFFLFLSTVFSQVQSGRVVYKLKENPIKMQEALGHKNLPVGGEAFFKSQFAQIKLVLPFMEYRLDFSKEEAVFSSTSFYMNNDSGLDFNLATSFIDVDGVYYANLKENLLVHALHSLKKDWLIKDMADVIEWELSDETKQILGYTCYKAIGRMPDTYEDKKETIVWFTPELPFQFGPVNKLGLPGLILEAEQGFYTLYADSIGFSERLKTIKKPNKGEWIERSDYDLKTLEARNKFR